MTNKLKELILYLARASRDDPTCGATKLNKLLFIMDFYAYAQFGKPITETKYIHRQFGPVPFDLPKIRRELLTEGRIQIEEREFLGKTQTCIIPTDDPDLSSFTKNELKLVNDVIEAFKGNNATELSEWTHKLRPWLDTEDGEEIPYNTVFILKEVPATQSDLAWGQKRYMELINAGYTIS